jgi:hypothetical protein
MKSFKLFLMCLGFIVITSMFGEWIVSREVNGFLQLLSFVGVCGIFIYIVNETISILFKNKKQND